MYDLIFADSGGKFFNHPHLKMVGRLGNTYVEPEEKEMIPLPEGASLVLLPERVPIGIDGKGGFTLAQGEGKPMWAVGALLPQGYTRTLIPGFRTVSSKLLPLYGYAAAGWRDGTVYVAAYPTDNPHKWNPIHYSTPELAGIVQDTLREYSNNRILQQLAQCALTYSCFTAQNIFYRRWEGGIPISPACNADCLGCISEQPAECCPAPQARIDFMPTSQEIIEIAIRHLTEAEEAIVSFGQGCEGEPSLSWEVAVQAITKVRQQTGAGTINMNTNAGFTKGIKALCAAGIDSLRVSTISALEDTYQAYYRPRNYTLADVRNSIFEAKDKGVFVSLNLLTYPGITDQERELEALVDMVDDLGIDMIQFRNLNIDPDYIANTLKLQDAQGMGIPALIECLSAEFPDLVIGSFSHPVKQK